MAFNSAYAKSIFLSTTFWGAVVSLVFSIAPHFSATVFGSASQTQIVSAILTGIGFVVTVYGRLTAKQAVSLTGGSGNPPASGASGSSKTGAWIIFAVAFVGLGLTGCNISPGAVEAGLSVADQVVQLAQDDIPGLQASGVLSTADATAALNWLTGADTILKQGISCTGSATSGNAAIVACVTAVGQGLLSPSEQADLRIISPAGQKKINLYVTAVILAVNGVEDIVKLVHTAVPTVGATPPPAPTTTELRELEHGLPARCRHLIEAYGY